MAQKRTYGGAVAARSIERELAAAELWAELNRLTGTVRGSLQSHLGEAMGLLPEEVDLLMLLDGSPEQRLRMADVSAALSMSKSGVTRLVDRLAGRGLVERAPCPKDRRVIYAGLTGEGRQAAAAAAPARAAGLTEALAGSVPPAEISALTESLRRLAPSSAGAPTSGTDA